MRPIPIAPDVVAASPPAAASSGEGPSGEAWTFTGEISRIGRSHGPVTLFDGASFCITDENGDIARGTAHGLFLLDCRFLSHMELHVDGHRAESLGVDVTGAQRATFFCRIPEPDRFPSPLTLTRHRSVGYGLRERIELRNHDVAPRRCTVELRVESDFADLFAVKEGRVRPSAASEETTPQAGQLSLRGDDGRRTHISVSPVAEARNGGVRWDVELAPGACWSATITVTASAQSHGITPSFAAGTGGEPRPTGDSANGQDVALYTDNHVLAAAVARALDDISALRLHDPDHPSVYVPAAGAPWFMTLFGRDSILTAWMALPFDSHLASGVVETLARLQGAKVDSRTEEEPGKIVHELRFRDSRSPRFATADRYYGSVDVTPLFVMLVGELSRWGVADDVVDRVLPNVDRALAWAASFGDRDGDGFIEYERCSDRGLVNQGWKDSWDGIRFADGSIAAAPLALCEVQGYLYAAYLARAELAEARGDDARRRRYRTLAANLKARFNRDFWLPDRGWFAVALDRDKRPVDALTSNIGHCLWTGIVDDDKAADVARRLSSPEMFSGWGVRTLASSMAGYNPVAYHCGSVWPHDTALAAAGLMRYGFVAEAHLIIEGLLAASGAHGGRLPELFAGVSRDELGVPAAYPTSCAPQAWAAAAPLLLLRTMLGLDARMPSVLHLAPAPPASVAQLTVENVRLGSGLVTIEATSTSTQVGGLPPQVRLVRAGTGCS